MAAVRLTCATCGDEFDARRSTARFCSDKCRVRAHRAKGPRLPAEVKIAAARPAPAAAPAPAPDGEPPTVEEAVRRELDKAERTGTVFGQAALVLARRLDQPAMDTGSAVSSLVKQLSATLEQALAGVESAGDQVDELRARRDRKLGAAG